MTKQTGSGEPSGTCRGILIVEPDPSYGELLNAALHRHRGAQEATIVDSLESAMMFLRKAMTAPHCGLPHTILLDVGASRSRESVRRLREEPGLASIPVTLLVSSDDPRDITACRASGADGHVVKPDTFDELVGLIAALCRHELGHKHGFAPLRP